MTGQKYSAIEGGAGKLTWSGEVLGVQPRIDLGRSFDQRQHSYLGYVLFLRGEAGGEAREFSVRIGPGAQARHALRAGDRLAGAAHPVADRVRVLDVYRAARNQSDYRGVPVSDSVAKECAVDAAAVLEQVRAWLAAHRPELC